MSKAPPLEDGEEVIFDHIPSLKAFKGTASLMLLLTLPVVAVFLVLFPDTFWPAVPLFVTSVLLAQERVTIGKHRAWVTNRRVLFQKDQVVNLSDVTNARPVRSAVRLEGEGTANGAKLFYPHDAGVLAGVINDARKEVA